MAFRDGERRRSGELPEDSSSSTGRSTSSGAATSLSLSGQEGGNGRGGSRDCPARPASNWVRRLSFSSRNRFVYSCNSAICMACSSCLTSISLCQGRSWSSGVRFAGLVVMEVNSGGTTGCLGIAESLEIGRSPRSGCTPSSCVPPLRLLARRFP